MAEKKLRNLPGNSVLDASTIANLMFNIAAGAQKNMEVGRHLLPLGDGAGGFTTNATTAKVLPSKGKNLAVYNNAGAVGSITLGEDNTVAVLASGVTDASGHVGIACKPNDWTYIACAEQNWVITSAATLLVYLIDDDSSIKVEASK